MQNAGSLMLASYVLGSELWESKFDGLLALVKEYIVDVWKIRKHKLYDSDSGSGLQLHTQSSPGERSGKFSQNGRFGPNGKFSQNGKFDHSGQKGKVYLGPNVSSSGQWQWCYGSNMSIIIIIMQNAGSFGYLCYLLWMCNYWSPKDSEFGGQYAKCIFNYTTGS